MLEQEIKRTLMRFGIRSNLKGFWYIVDAARYIVENDDFRNLKVMSVYSAVGETYGENWKRVERCIRHAIERMYIMCEIDAIAAVLGERTNLWTGKLTNKEFLWTLADHFADVGKMLEAGA